MKFEKIMELLNDKKYMIVAFTFGWLLISDIKLIPLFMLALYIYVHLYHIYKK